MISGDFPETGRGWFLKGLRDACGVPALMIMATMCGIGGLVRDVGYPAWAGTLSTLLIWAGPAQVLLFAALAQGAALPATAFAVALSSSRFLPMSVSLLPLVRSGGARLPAALLAAHMVSMTTWVEGLRRLPHVPPQGRYAYFMGYSCVIIGVASAMTHAGYYLYATLPGYLSVAFLFTTPLFFAAAMAAGARSAADWSALAFGFFATPPLSQVIPAGFDFLAIGLIGGTFAFWLSKRARKGAA